MKKILILVVIAIALFVIFGMDKEDVVTYPTPSQNNATTTEPTGRAMSVEDYIKLNISELSGNAGTPETMGGKFYVTDISTSGGAGVVSYEDGHNAYTANFNYKIAENGFITITSFAVKQ